MSEDKDLWIKIQQRTFTRWANTFLIDRMMKIDDLAKDLSDGIKLINLVEIISAKNLGKYNPKPKIKAQLLENCAIPLRFLQKEGLKLVGIGPEDLVEGELKLILGLIWTIILRYQIQRGEEDGSSAKSELLKWVRSKIPEYDIKNFTKDWQNGKAITALAKACEPSLSLTLPRDFKNDSVQDAGLGMNMAEKDMNIPKVLDPEDMVFNPDELSNMTYISYFRDYEEKMRNRNRDLEFNITPVAAKCQATGIQDGEVGIPQEFTIESRNGKGGLTGVGGHNFTCDIDGPKGKIPCQVIDNKNGTYTGKFTPQHAGKHDIKINLDGTPIGGSPYKCNVVPSKPDPKLCEMYGPGLKGGEANKPAVFTIKAKNRLGEPIKEGGHPFKVNVDGPFEGSTVPCQIKDNGDGTYTCTYIPTEQGDHLVTATLKGDIVAEPVHVNIGRDTSAADPSMCDVFGPGVDGGANTSEPAKFKIVSKDSKGNKIPHGGDIFDCEVTDPEGNIIPSRLKDNGDGTYDVEYDTPNPGNYNVDVMLRNKDKPLFFDHVKGYPKTVEILPGVSAKQTLCYGPGLTDGILDTQPTHFIIETRNPKGEKIKSNGEKFDIDIKGPQGGIPHKITDNGDGTYRVEYAPKGPGNHKIEVKYRGDQVANSPYNIRVDEGADAGNSFVDGYSFVIRTCSKAGKRLANGGEKDHIDVKIQGSKGDVSGIEISDKNDGTYLVNYKLPSNGTYRINILINGSHIKGSPINQTF